MHRRPNALCPRMGRKAWKPWVLLAVEADALRDHGDQYECGEFNHASVSEAYTAVTVAHMKRLHGCFKANGASQATSGDQLFLGHL